MRAFSGVALPPIVTMLGPLVGTGGAAGASEAATARFGEPSGRQTLVT